jgi:hypothetical protein
MPDGVVDLRIEVLIRLTERNLTASQKEQISDNVRTAVMRYVEDLPMGAPFVHNKLLGQIVQDDALADAVLLSGPRTGGPFAGVMGNLSMSERKARVDPYQVFVGLMDEGVSIDLRVRLDGERVPDGLEAQVRDAVARQLALAKGRLAKSDIRDAIRQVADAAKATLAEGNAVTMAAEFEDTGRLLTDAAEVVLADHEVAVLRDLVLEVKGPLSA